MSEAHAILGFGRIASRREKVARWESGTVVPDVQTQYAIAHLHKVAHQEVHRLGWPHWLHLGATDPELRATPHVPDDAGVALRHAWRDGRASPGAYVSVTGQRLSTFVRSLCAQCPATPRWPQQGQFSWERTGYYVALVGSLEGLAPEVSPAALLPAARADLGNLTMLLSCSALDREAKAELAVLAARVADLCGRLSMAVGRWVDAERYFLGAARAAATQGRASLVAGSLSNLAVCHMQVGEPRDGLLLVETSSSLTGNRPSSVSALRSCREAIGLARLGDEVGSARALERAADMISVQSEDEDVPTGMVVNEEWLSISSGIVWTDLGKPRKALVDFSPILGPEIPAKPFRMPSWVVVQVVRAHLEAGEPEEAARHAGRALSFFGGFSLLLAAQLRSEFTPFRSVPAVAALLAELRAAVLS
ncbi:hypothetical protein [Kitasatospora sp. NPDC089509]|uniref:hypothetical protein n=1 Tax=Kitasatospora sp. NPDC089509 TaxID=3364079 RepID=UPI00382BAD9A